MTWTYSGNPGSSVRDAVRFLVGDTNPKSQLLTDEEIQYLIGENGATKTIVIAIDAVEKILAKLSTEYDQSVGAVSYSLNQRIENYRKLLVDLRRKSVVTGATPYCGGISISDKCNRKSNPDRTIPKFTVDLHQNPELPDEE